MNFSVLQRAAQRCFAWIPAALISVGAATLPRMHRDEIEGEWRAELHFIATDSDSSSAKRFLTALRFAASLVLSAPAVGLARSDSSLRWLPAARVFAAAGCAASSAWLGVLTYRHFNPPSVNLVHGWADPVPSSFAGLSMADPTAIGYLCAPAAFAIVAICLAAGWYRLLSLGTALMTAAGVLTYVGGGSVLGLGLAIAAFCVLVAMVLLRVRLARARA